MLRNRRHACDCLLVLWCVFILAERVSPGCGRIPVGRASLVLHATRSWRAWIRKPSACLARPASFSASRPSRKYARLPLALAHLSFREVSRHLLDPPSCRLSVSSRTPQSSPVGRGRVTRLECRCRGRFRHFALRNLAAKDDAHTVERKQVRINQRQQAILIPFLNHATAERA